MIAGAIMMGPHPAMGGSPASSTCPTHAQFVQSGLRQAADSLFAIFPFQRGKPLLIVADDSGVANPWFADAASRQMYRRGMLVQESGGRDPHPGEGVWVLRYRFNQYTLTLSDPRRRAFLGTIWVRRSFRAAVSVGLWDEEAGDLLWINSLDTTFEDQIPKREFLALADPAVPFLSPPPPVTPWERNSEPVKLTAAVAVLGAAFLLLR